MLTIIIGNFIAFIASLLMVYTGFIKDKKRILYIQTIEISLFVVSNVILGGITGAINNAITCIRNILCYKNKLGLKEKILIIILASILTIFFNNTGIVGLLPLIALILYTSFMNIQNIIKFKILLIINSTIWLIYDIYVNLYTSAIFDLATIIANIISIIQIKTKKQIETTENT